MSISTAKYYRAEPVIYHPAERTQTHHICREKNGHLTVTTDHGKRELVHRTPGTDSWEPVQDLTEVSGREVAENYGLARRGIMRMFGPQPMEDFYREQGFRLVNKEHLSRDGKPDPGNEYRGTWSRTYAQVSYGEIQESREPLPAGKAMTNEYSAGGQKKVTELFPPGYSGFLRLQWTPSTTTHEPDWSAGLNRSGGILEGGGSAYYGGEYVVSHHGKDPGAGVIIDDLA